MTVSASLKPSTGNLELAAFGLGASRAIMFRRIHAASRLAGVAAAAVFAFIASFDDVVLALFLTNGPVPYSAEAHVRRSGP